MKNLKTREQLERELQKEKTRLKELVEKGVLTDLTVENGKEHGTGIFVEQGGSVFHDVNTGRIWEERGELTEIMHNPTLVEKATGAVVDKAVRPFLDRQIVACRKRISAIESKLAAMAKIQEEDVPSAGN